MQANNRAAFHSSLLPTLPNATRRPPLPHLFHLHIAKMAGRSLMMDGPSWLGTHKCSWSADLSFYGHERELVGRIGSRAGSMAPCFVSYEASYRDIGPAYVKAIGRGPTVIVLLRSAMSWVVSAAEHFQRPNEGCSPYPCHRNDGLEDLVASGCFWQPGQPAANAALANGAAKCTSSGRGNYPFPMFAVGRLASFKAVSPESSMAHVERVVAEVRQLVENSLVGLTEAYTASLCLFRHQLGLPVATYAACSSLCSAGSSSRRLRVRRLQQLAQPGGSASAPQPPLPRHVGNQAVDAARQLNISNTLSAESLKIVEQAMLMYTRIYAHGTDVFLQRVTEAEDRAQVRLLC